MFIIVAESIEIFLPIDQLGCFKAWSIDTFLNLGVIKNRPEYDDKHLNNFEDEINKLKHTSNWNKKLIINQFFKLLPGFTYVDKEKYLNGKM